MRIAISSASALLMAAFLLVAAALLELAAPAAAPAAGLRVEPGLWEFRSSLPDPLSGDTSGQVHRTCVRDGNITPERVMAQVTACRISNAVIKGPTARWKMRCETPAGPMNGSGSLRTNGVAVSGALELTMMVGSFEIPASSTFTGRRVGRCR